MMMAKKVHTRGGDPTPSSDPLAYLNTIRERERELAEEKRSAATSVLESLRSKHSEIRESLKEIAREAHDMCQNTGLTTPSWARQTLGLDPSQARPAAPASSGGGGGTSMTGRKGRAKLSGPYAGMTLSDAIVKVISDSGGTAKLAHIKEALEAHGGNPVTIGVECSRIAKMGRIATAGRGYWQLP